MDVSGRGPWRVLGTVLIRLGPIVALLALTRLAPEHIRHVADLIFYGGLLIGTGFFLVFVSRRPAPSERSEAFRKAARITALGFFLLAAFALVMLTLAQPNSTPPLWTLVFLPVSFAGAGFFMWRGNRKYSEAADAYPGKHANPGTPPGAHRPRLAPHESGDPPRGPGDWRAGCRPAPVFAAA